MSNLMLSLLLHQEISNFCRITQFTTTRKLFSVSQSLARHSQPMSKSNVTFWYTQAIMKSNVLELSIINCLETQNLLQSLTSRNQLNTLGTGAKPTVATGDSVYGLVCHLQLTLLELLSTLM